MVVIVEFPDFMRAILINCTAPVYQRSELLYVIFVFKPKGFMVQAFRSVQVP